MKKLSLGLFTFILIFAFGVTAQGASILERMQGYILLQVEEHGEAWYVREDDGKRYYMRDGNAAYQMMRFFSLGITDADLFKIPQVADTTEMLDAPSVCGSNTLAESLKGKILLQVEQHGEAWYVFPTNCRMIYMADGEAAYTIMRFLGQGITTSDLETIPEGNPEGAPGYQAPPTSSDTSSSEQTTSSSEPLAWPTDIGTSRFGRLTDIGRVESEISGGWVRPHSGPFVWNWIERSPGVLNWAQADAEVKYWQNKRQAILATVWGFAEWDQETCHTSADSTNQAFLRDMSWMHAPCDMDAYHAWLTKLVERYDGDGVDDMPGLLYPVRHWEIFNEPDLQPIFFQDDAATYAELLNSSAAIVRAADANAVILPAGQSGMMHETETYWDTVLATTKDAFDIGNIHSISASDVFWSDSYQTYLNGKGLAHRDYWITEALVGSMQQPNQSDDALARLAFTGYVNAFANGADVIFDVGNHDPTSSFGTSYAEAFDVLVDTIGEFETVERITDRSAQFTLGSGEVVYAIWDGGRLPDHVSGEMTVVEYDGTMYPRSAGTITGTVPLFAR